jgi:hypothetical protein
MIPMALKGLLLNLGSGEKKTNPISEFVLAKICIEAILQKNAYLEAGGKQIYSRKELYEIM